MSQRKVRLKDMPLPNQPLEERFRIVGKAWADNEAAYQMLREAKTTTLERLKTQIIDERAQDGLALAENKAERLAKCESKWQDYLDQMAEHNALRLDYQIEKEYIEMLERKLNRDNANSRSERWMHR